MAEGKLSNDDPGNVGRTMVLIVLLTVPVLKLAWTLGGGPQAREALIAMEPGNWLDIVIGMFLTEALLASVLAMVVARLGFLHLAKRRKALRALEVPVALTASTAALVPASLGLVVGAFNGLGWGLLTALGSYAMILGIIVEYRAGRRSPETGRRVRWAAETPAQRAADVAGVVGIALALVVLPVTALAAALDGRAWSVVLQCEVDTGHGPHRTRVIELARKGNGVVGWDIADGEAVNGLNCGADENEVVREPWWRSLG